MPAADFITPKGLLLPEQFPPTPEERAAGKTAESKLTALVTAWEADATTRTDIAAAREAWVYYRANRHLADRLYGNPSEVNVAGQAGASFLVSQMQRAEQQAADYLARYTELTAPPPATTEEPWAVALSLR